jgi:hypothetical protein
LVGVKVIVAVAVRVGERVSVGEKVAVGVLVFVTVLVGVDEGAAVKVLVGAGLVGVVDLFPQANGRRTVTTKKRIRTDLIKWVQRIRTPS